jgi:nitrogen regulatory protein P-II 2
MNPMETHPLTLLTIVSEHVLRERLIHELLTAGARGYTIYEVEGEGSRHRRVSDVLGANIKIETVVSDQLAQRLLQILFRDYFPDHAIIAYTSTVHVLRGEKYA